MRIAAAAAALLATLTLAAAAPAQSPPETGFKSPALAGVACVSQTGGPETVLAGEARLPFALIGFVTDHAHGVTEELTPAETLARLFGESGGVFQTALRAALPRIAADPGEPAGIVFSL